MNGSQSNERLPPSPPRAEAVVGRGRSPTVPPLPVVSPSNRSLATADPLSPCRHHRSAGSTYQSSSPSAPTHDGSGGSGPYATTPSRTAQPLSSATVSTSISNAEPPVSTLAGTRHSLSEERDTLPLHHARRPPPSAQDPEDLAASHFSPAGPTALTASGGSHSPRVSAAPQPQLVSSPGGAAAMHAARAQLPLTSSLHSISLSSSLQGPPTVALVWPAPCSAAIPSPGGCAHSTPIGCPSLSKRVAPAEAPTPSPAQQEAQSQDCSMGSGSACPMGVHPGISADNVAEDEGQERVWRPATPPVFTNPAPERRAASPPPFMDHHHHQYGSFPAQPQPPPPRSGHSPLQLLRSASAVFPVFPTPYAPSVHPLYTDPATAPFSHSTGSGSQSASRSELLGQAAASPSPLMLRSVAWPLSPLHPEDVATAGHTPSSPLTPTAASWVLVPLRSLSAAAGQLDTRSDAATPPAGSRTGSSPSPIHTRARSSAAPRLLGHSLPHFVPCEVAPPTEALTCAICLGSSREQDAGAGSLDTTADPASVSCTSTPPRGSARAQTGSSEEMGLPPRGPPTPSGSASFYSSGGGGLMLTLDLCRHSFHQNCLQSWLLHHTQCPLCRRPLCPPA